jgi:hypothetical protein
MKTETLAVTSARYVDDLRLELRFSDGAVRTLDFRPSIERQHVPEYRAYLDPLKFKEFKTEAGNVVWGEDWDLVYPVWKLYEGLV